MRSMARGALGVAALMLALGAAPARSDYAAGAVFFAQKNYAGAFAELLPAARGGDALAQFMLGVMYDLGRHVAIDKAVAAQWYAQAAEQGHPDAQMRLASMLYAGEGVASDREAAYRWALLSVKGASAGSKRDKADLLAQQVAKLLTENQIARAQASAEEWAPRLASTPDRDRAQGPRLKRSGTGFFISEDGSMLTALHVVHPSCPRLMISYGDGPAAEAQIAHFDLLLDVALLRTAIRPQRVASFSTYDEFRPGMAVTITGYAIETTKQRRPLTASGLMIDQATYGGTEGFFRTSVVVHHGQSGGPVLDDDGRVVGLAKAILRYEQVASDNPQEIKRSLAVGRTAILGFLERAKATGRIQKTINASSASESRASQAGQFMALVECWGQ